MDMLYEREIRFKFKGSRNYVSGTDIFNNILDVAIDYFGKYPKLLKGAFHRNLKNCGLIRIYYENEETVEYDVFARFLLNIENTNYIVTLTETKKEVVSKIEYIENNVIHGFKIKERSIILLKNDSYSYIEQIVAMTKKLHFEVYPNVKKWLFSKIELQDMISPSLYRNKLLVVEAKSNFYNRLTKNSIYLEGANVGNIYFSGKNRLR